MTMTHSPTQFDDIAGDTAEDIPSGFLAVKVGGPFIFHISGIFKIGQLFGDGRMSDPLGFM